MRRLILAVFVIVTPACSDRTSNESTDGPQSIDATSNDATSDGAASTDAATTDAATTDASPACGSTLLGSGVRADIAYATGHFAVSHLAVGFNVTVTRLTEAGAVVGSATTLGLDFSVVRPAIAGRDTFLLAYIAPPDGAIGLAPLLPGGSLGPSVLVPSATSMAAELQLAPSHGSGEFALTFLDFQQAKFVRLAADGSVLVGPITLPTGPDEYVAGVAYRPSGWALVTKLQASVNLLLVDNDGAVTSTVPLPDSAILGGIEWTGSELALTLWDSTFDVQLRRLSEDGVALASDQLLVANALNPGGLAWGSGGYTISYVDFARNMHILHANGSGVTDSDNIVGSDLHPLYTPTAVAVSQSGARAAAWHINPPGGQLGAWFAIDCP